MDFTDPFAGNIDRNKKMDREGLIRAIRMDIAAEHDTAALYRAHAFATDNETAKLILLDIANEERVHAGEFMKLLDILTDGQESELLSKGEQEVRDKTTEE